MGRERTPRDAPPTETLANVTFGDIADKVVIITGDSSGLAAQGDRCPGCAPSGPHFDRGAELRRAQCQGADVTDRDNAVSTPSMLTSIFPSHSSTLIERPGDLCYFKPWGNLALFYADYRWDGLIRLGRFDDGFEPLLVRGKVPVRIERSDDHDGLSRSGEGASWSSKTTLQNSAPPNIHFPIRKDFI